MIWNFLTDGASNAAQKSGNNWMNIVLIGVLLVGIIVMFLFSGRKNKQSQKEYAEAIDAIRPGNKVKTAGGICGVVVEISDSDGTFIIKTGSEDSGYSFIRMDKSMISETDAKGPTQILREEVEAKRKAEKEAKKGSPQTPVSVEQPAEQPEEEKTEEEQPKE